MTHEAIEFFSFRLIVRDSTWTTMMFVATGFIGVVGYAVEIVENEARGGDYRHTGENQPHRQFESHRQNDPEDRHEMIVRREPLPQGPRDEGRRQCSLQTICHYLCQLPLRDNSPMFGPEIFTKNDL